MAAAAAAASPHFLLLFVSLLLLTATTVSAENQHLQLLQDVSYPPPLTKPLTPPAKPYTPTPASKPPTPPLKPPVPPVVTPPPKAPATPPVVTPPTPYRPPVKKEECGTLCLARCKLHSRPGLCVRACSTCCVRCKCVPPGTYGNRELCGKCYTDMRTHGNRFKCP